jgi:hypothetical protein
VGGRGKGEKWKYRQRKMHTCSKGSLKRLEGLARLELLHRRAQVRVEQGAGHGTAIYIIFILFIFLPFFWRRKKKKN